MKITKVALLFYNSILIFSLITIGFATKSYQDLTSTILLLPVWMYFSLSLANKITKISPFIKNPSVNRLMKILRFYSLGVVLLLVFANLASSYSFIQSTLTIVFLPLLVSFWLELFNKKTILQFRLKKVITFNKLFSLKKAVSKSNKLTKFKLKKKKKSKKVYKKKNKQIEVLEPEKDGLVAEDVTAEFEDMLNIKDQKRRQFLKIVGGGGVSLFLMLFVFQQKASAAFFGSAPGPGVVSIKDSEGTKIDPAEKQPTDGYSISELDDDSSPAYYGFVHKNGAWYIAKEDSSGSYRYVSGASNFSTSWTNRAGLTYDYFDNIF